MGLEMTAKLYAVIKVGSKEDTEHREARKQVEQCFMDGANIQKGETIKEVCKFIKDNVQEYHKGEFYVDDFIKDLKKVLEDEK